MPNPPNRATSGLRRPEELPHTCAKCTNRWSGANTAHCATCHNTFTGVAAFDKHRQNGKCAHPAEVNLTLNPTRAYPCWGTTTTDEPDLPNTTPTH